MASQNTTCRRVFVPVVRCEPVTPPPHLPTLRQPASWLNAAGNVDRAACVEITIAEARELAGCVPHKARSRARSGEEHIKACRTRTEHRHRDGGRFAPNQGFGDDGLTRRQRRLLSRCGGDNDEPSVRPLPHERPAINGHGRVAAGVITLTAGQLRWLNDQRMPRMLAGDFRTSRAPAMRGRHVTPGKSKGARFRCRIDRTQKIAFPRARNLDPNPNKGASRDKVTDLADDWHQLLVVEKWEYPGRIRPAYYFICPCDAKPGHPATMSKRKRGREHPMSGQCPQRCRKLLMVQCTRDEQRDSHVAAQWIATLTAAATTQPRIRVFARELLRRYGMIFPPRLLLCPRCVGVRYGNDPETVRCGWRRRNGKPDVSVHSGGDPANLMQADVPLSRQNRLLLQDLRERRDDRENRAQRRNSPEGRARRLKQHRDAAERRVQRDSAAVQRSPEEWKAVARMLGPNGDAKLRAFVNSNEMPPDLRAGAFNMQMYGCLFAEMRKRRQRLEANAKRISERIDRLAEASRPKKASDTGL